MIADNKLWLGHWFTFSFEKVKAFFTGWRFLTHQQRKNLTGLRPI
jgi:hypothetical protein